MRDPNLMLNLLRLMAEQPRGSIDVPWPYDPTDEELSLRHHVELLVDGHAQWTGHQHDVVRMTNAGYDFLNAVNQGDTYIAKFTEHFNSGVPYAQAALHIVQLVAKAAGG